MFFVKTLTYKIAHGKNLTSLQLVNLIIMNFFHPCQYRHCPNGRACVQIIQVGYRDYRVLIMIFWLREFRHVKYITNIEIYYLIYIYQFNLIYYYFFFNIYFVL